MDAVTMNTFVDVLHNNVDTLLNTETLPGLVLSVQKVLVQNNLENTKAGKMLIKALLNSSSHSEATQHLFRFMI